MNQLVLNGPAVTVPNQRKTLLRYPSLNLEDNRAYKVFNIFVIIAVLQTFLVTLSVYQADKSGIHLIPLFEGVLFIICLVLHLRGHFSWVRMITFVLAASVQVLACVLTGKEIGYELPFFALAVCPILFLKKFWQYFPIGLFSIVCFFVTQYLYTVTDPIMESRPEQYYSNALITFLLVYFTMQTFRKDHEKNELVLNEKNRILSQQHSTIVDSIKYAEKIQTSLLGSKDAIKGVFDNSFILFKPKDIVSGDFYWFGLIGDKKIAMAVDCTGHGVPGAFMTMLGVNLLNQIILVEEISDPARIIASLNSRLLQSFQKREDGQYNKDGMDMVLAIVDERTRKMSLVGVRNAVYLLRKAELTQFPPSKVGVGEGPILEQNLLVHEVNYQPGDRVYLCSDGYQDQFSNKGEKFMKRNFRKLLADTSRESIAGQMNALEKNLREWRQGEEQTDDILVIGIEL